MTDKVVTDTLFLALTRPAMKWGVPYEGFCCNIVGSFMIGLWLGSPVYWIVAGPIHLLMRALASLDHNFFRVRRLQIETRGKSVGSDVWGGSSLGPLPIWPARNSTETRGSV